MVGWAHKYRKGVTVRFGFDVIRISQIQLLVKNKATGNAPSGVYKHRHALWTMVCKELEAIYTSVWGFQRCSFRQAGQCESLYDVERASGLAPRFFCFYVITLLNHRHSGANGTQ